VSEPERLLDLAAAVAVGSEVDWDLIERQSADDRERSVVRELRLIAGIAEVARNPSSKRTVSGGKPDQGPPPPESWGQLRVLGRIGHGSFGAVYRAWDSKLERHVALKLVLPSGVSSAFDLSRALREARLLARVRHPNVVSVFGADCHDDRFGLWMELVNGLTLEELLKTHGTMSAREAAAIGVDLCHALAAVHRAKLLHRDIKASNVMREDGGRIVLMDLGAGRRMPTVDDPVDPLAGTPLYLAPELLAGEKPSVASDIYSVGVLLYHLVSGRYPVTGTNRDEVARAHEGKARVSLRDVRPDLPPAFIHTIDRALVPEPALRYRTAGDFGSALAALAGVRYERDPGAWPDWRIGAGAVAVAAALLVGVAQLDRDAPVDPEREAPAAATVAAPASYNVRATFYAVRNGANIRLTAGSRVAPGDHLFLTLDVSRPVHVYVVNQDEAGEAYLLFPLPGNEPQNPIPLNATNQLPGSRNGEAQFWQVTSAGGREHFLVYVAPERLTDFEQMLAVLPRAEADRPVEAVPLTARAMGALRGVGGLAAPREQPSAQAIPGLADLKPLPETGEATTGIWARRISFENPRSP
jgi:eukaryotic-like serine/threonine-protein kinase